VVKEKLLGCCKTKTFPKELLVRRQEHDQKLKPTSLDSDNGVTNGSQICFSSCDTTGQTHRLRMLRMCSA